MCLFVTLALLLAVLTIAALISIGVGGALFVLVFGDIIVFIIIITYMMRRNIKKKFNNK